MNVRDTIHSTFGIALGTAACYGTGIIYGAINKVDRTVAARAFSITIATKMTFDLIAKMVHLTGSNKNKSHFHATHLAGDALFLAITTVAFRHLNLIGNLGTAFIAFGALIISLENYDRLRNS